MQIKKGDNVIVIAGKDKGKKAKVVRSVPSENRIVVEGVNLLKKRQKPRKGGQKGQMISVSMPIDSSNVLVFCSKCDKGVRIGSKVSGNTKKRICKKCGFEL